MAQEEARLLDHDYIGTEHLLLGLAREGEGIGSVALEALKISLTSLRQQIATVIGRGTSPPVAQIPFSRRAKMVLDLSLMEALKLRHDLVGPEHLLLGIVREGEGVAARVLIELGADLERVRTTVMRLLEGAPLIERAPSFASGARTIPVGGARLGWVVSCALCGRERTSLLRFVRGPRELICLECIERAHDCLITTSGREGTLPPFVEGDTPTPTAAEEVLAAFTAA